MLRAGICDLGTCDLKMRRPSVRPAPPAGPLCDSSAPGSWAASSARKSEGSPRIRHPARRLACVQRRIGQPVVRSVRGSLTCSVTVWRPLICRVYAPPRCAFAACFRSAPCVSAPSAVAFLPGRAPRVSPGVPSRFPWSAAAFPPGYLRVSAGRRAQDAACSRRGRPHGLAPEPAAGPLPGRAIHFRAARNGTDPAVPRPTVSH